MNIDEYLIRRIEKKVQKFIGKCNAIHVLLIKLPDYKQVESQRPCINNENKTFCFQ